jgi:hypothetical protein
MKTQLKEQYLTDTEGNKIAVVIDIKTYQELLEELDELRCEKAYQQAVIETETDIINGDYLTLINTSKETP